MLCYCGEILPEGRTDLLLDMCGHCVVCVCVQCVCVVYYYYLYCIEQYYALQMLCDRPDDRQ